MQLSTGRRPHRHHSTLSQHGGSRVGSGEVVRWCVWLGGGVIRKADAGWGSGGVVATTVADSSALGSGQFGHSTTFILF